MDTYTIQVQERIPAAKSVIRKLKTQGYVPGVLYGGHQNVPISIQDIELKNIISKHGESVLLNLSYGGKLIPARIQQIQRDPVSKDITHVDLMPLPNQYLQ